MLKQYGESKDVAEMVYFFAVKNPNILMQKILLLMAGLIDKV